MSDAAVPAESQTPHFKSASARSLPARLMAFFSGTNGLIAKFVLLGGFNAIVVWAATILATHHKWVPLLVVALAAAAIDVIYMIPRESLIPAKFLIPGTMFLVGFTVIPIVYTINIAFTNYSTGHILSKSEAIEQIQLSHARQPTERPDVHHLAGPRRRRQSRPPHGQRHDARDLRRHSARSSSRFRTRRSRTARSRRHPATSSYRRLFRRRTRQLHRPAVRRLGDPSRGPDRHGRGARRCATTRRPTRSRASPTASSTTTTAKAPSSPSDGKQLTTTGWKTYNGFKQFSKIVTDPLYRRPFLRVLLWTVVFAASTVLLSFALGLFLAITLQKKFLGQRVYRSLLVIPYAVPAFLTILVWGGLLTDTAIPGS